jgi:hypothetical protein
MAQRAAEARAARVGAWVARLTAKHPPAGEQHAARRGAQHPAGQERAVIS